MRPAASLSSLPRNVRAGHASTDAMEATFSCAARICCSSPRRESSSKTYARSTKSSVAAKTGSEYTGRTPGLAGGAPSKGASSGSGDAASLGKYWTSSHHSIQWSQRSLPYPNWAVNSRKQGESPVGRYPRARLTPSNPSPMVTAMARRASPSCRASSAVFNMNLANTGIQWRRPQQRAKFRLRRSRLMRQILALIPPLEPVVAKMKQRGFTDGEVT